MSLFQNEDILTKKKLNQSFADSKWNVISLKLLLIPRLMYTADSIYAIKKEGCFLLCILK
jgi:hypothetical protein